MGLTKPIPPKLRAELDREAYYHRCCVTGLTSRQTKIEWHHNFTHGSKRGRVNERWCILPLSADVHDKARTREVKDILDWIMLNRADESTLRGYSKAEDLIAKRDRLNKRYGTYKEDQDVLPGADRKSVV